MRSLAAAFLLSLLALTASAAEADLEMNIYPFGGPRVQIGSHVGYYVVVTNKGPGDAHDLRFKVTPADQARNIRVSPGDSVVPCPNFECSVALLRANESKSFGIDEDFDRKTMTVSTTATVSATETDPNPANNTVTVTTEIVEASQIAAFLDTGGPTEAEGPATMTAYIFNQGIVPAQNVVLDLDFPAGTVITGSQPPANWTCEASGTRLSCRTDVLPKSFDRVSIPISVIAPPRYEGGYLIVNGRLLSTTIDLDTGDHFSPSQWLFYHLFVVSSTADMGSGTLRQAIMDTNAVCGNNCRVAFRIPEAQRERGWFIIRPASPLPALNSPVTIAGPPGAQPEGHRVNPQVMLDGSRLTFGDGLVLSGGNGGGITGLAIGNFPGAGILTLGSGIHLIEESFVGTWPNGLEAAPNTRGIYGIGPQQLTVRHNVVSGNRRSGITLLNMERPQITRNAIGVGANGVTPVPNGASGVYLGEKADWAFFFNNDIAYNVDFGIALHPTVRRMLASVNAIYGNGQLGIDAGIDLETPNVDDDKDRIPNHPVLTSARWDGQRTIIEGEMHSNTTTEFPFFLRLRVELYADDAAHPEAHEFLGTAQVNKGKFTLTVKRDLRGTNVTGIGIRWLKVEQYDEYLLGEETSEISPALRVE